MSIDEKINRIRCKKTCGKFIYGIAVIVLLVLILVKVDTVCTMAADGLNQQMEHRQITEVETPIVEATESALADDDREYIARVLMAEAGSDISGLMAVAQVISDRSHLWNMTPLEAVTQDGQFAEPIQGEISAEAVQAVWAVFDEGMRAFDSNVTHFHSGSEEPYWTENKTFIGTRGGNRFYESKY